MSNRGFILLARGFLAHPRLRPKGAFSNAEAMLWLNPRHPKTQCRQLRPETHELRSGGIS